MKKLMIQTSCYEFFRPFFIPVLFLLAACNRAVPATPVAVVNTAVPAPTMTIEETEMETKTAVSATPTVTPTPIPTATPLPAATPFPTFPAQVPLPPDTTFVLRPPDSAVLLAILQNITTQRAERWSLTTTSLYTLIGEDLKQFYPNGLPNGESVVTDSFYQWVAFFPPFVIWDVVRQGLVQYINSEKIELVSRSSQEIASFSITTQSVNLDTDSNSELLLQVSSQQHDIWGLLPLEIDSPGSYTMIHNDITAVNNSLFGYDAQGIVRFDLTGDGIPEILKITQEYAMGNIQGSIDVFAWDGEGIYLIESINIGSPAYKNPPEYQITDYTGDGQPDIRVTTSHYRNFGCEWQEIDLYSWSGITPHHQLMPDGFGDEGVPDTVECNLWRAMSPTVHMTPAQRIELLEVALPQLIGQTTTSPDYLALIYVHLAMAYAGLRNDAQAHQALEQLYDLPADSPFVQVIRQNYETTGYNLTAVCQNLYTHPEHAVGTGVEDYIYSGSDRGFHGAGSAEYQPRQLCNPFRLSQERLLSAVLPLNQPPATGFLSYGYTFSFAQSLDLDEDAELEWLGIVEGEDKYLVVMDATGIQWGFAILESVYGEVETFTYESKIIESEVFVVGILKKLIANCDPAQTSAGELILIHHQENQLILETSWLECNQPLPSLAKITPQTFRELSSFYPNWQTLIDYPATDLELYDYVRELEQHILTRDDSQIVADLTTLITYLPADDPEAQPVINQLTYVLGYYYELEGDEEQAITTYLQLIQQAPDSPWSWLAWARLEPIP